MSCGISVRSLVGSRRFFCSGIRAAALCGIAGLPSLVSLPSIATTRAATHRAEHRKAPALTPWEQAEEAREQLEQIPEENRTRADYARALDAYRSIYHTNPGDDHAAAAVYSVAELLAEQGRTLHDRKSLESAVAQYEFLRKQYPGSSLRVQALLNEGQIEQNDLNDSAAAREMYSTLIRLHPHNAHADEARAALASLDEENARHSVPPPKNSVTQETPTVAAPPDSGNTASADASPQVSASPGRNAKPTDVAATGESRHPARRAAVTGIRHWSTATYTRVAIDLGDSVTYEAARVPNPDRIYFDLHGTRLAQELAGKSFNVTDDGFLKRIRAAQYSEDVTRVVLDVNHVTEYSAFLLPNPYRLIIDIHGGKTTAAPSHEAAEAAPQPYELPAMHAAATARPTPARPVPNSVATRTSPGEVADVSEQPGRVDATHKPTSKPISAVVDTSADRSAKLNDDSADSELAETPAKPSAPSSNSLRRGRGRSKAAANPDATPARAAAPMADGETSLVRALGLKIGRIVIDAGHGGHDSGTLGVDGIEEKDVVLDVALRVGKLLHDRLGAEIVYTRSDDTFIPLETRTAIANKAQADLFLSIHANSSSDPTARGVETYYLNFTSDPTALDVAARENAVSDQSIHQLSDLVKKIALKDKIAESREFASDVENSLYAGLEKGNTGLKNRGVKKAPFVVLIGANMPSILAEISFVTNPKDAAELRKPEYRERVAESLYRGVARYEAGLSASKSAVESASVGQ